MRVDFGSCPRVGAQGSIRIGHGGVRNRSSIDVRSSVGAAVESPIRVRRGGTISMGSPIWIGGGGSVGDWHSVGIGLGTPINATVDFLRRS